MNYSSSNLKKIAQIAASRAHRVRCAAAGLHRSVPMETCFFFLNLFCIFYWSPVTTTQQEPIGEPGERREGRNERVSVPTGRRQPANQPLDSQAADSTAAILWKKKKKDCVGSRGSPLETEKTQIRHQVGGCLWTAAGSGCGEAGGSFSALRLRHFLNFILFIARRSRQQRLRKNETERWLRICGSNHFLFCHVFLFFVDKNPVKRRFWRIILNKYHCFAPICAEN